MERFPTPKQLAEEARRLLDANPMTSEEHWEFLIKRGIIDREGRVLVPCKYFDADGKIPPQEPPPPNGATPPPAEPG